MSRWQRAVAWGVAAIVIIATIAAVTFLRRNVPEVHAGIDEHFKYGSIGSEAGAGVPYWLWRVMPAMFPEHLPDRPGRGYEKMGFIYESATHDRPIGTSYREQPVGLVGLNCAACHAGTVREAPDAEPQIVLGMTANTVDVQAYVAFLFAVGADERLTASNVIREIRRVNPAFSTLDALVYRFLVLPKVREVLTNQAAEFAWMATRPPSGPGRIDSFNPFNAYFGLDPYGTDIVGTAKLPPLWNQEVRAEMWLHWDGNTNSVHERTFNAAVAAGGIRGMGQHVDRPAVDRVVAWTWDQIEPPAFPPDRVDRDLAARGSDVFRARCAHCHALDGDQVGQVTDIAEVGTDRGRLDSVTQELIDSLLAFGAGEPWEYTNFRKTNGYSNMPLDGLWLRAPYLHNGSVPTLRDLLAPPDARPAVFHTGYDVYDFDALGFVSAGPEAEAVGFRLDTSLPGNGNQGHLYGTDLDPAEKVALLEYLKTL